MHKTALYVNISVLLNEDTVTRTHTHTYIYRVLGLNCQTKQSARRNWSHKRGIHNRKICGWYYHIAPTWNQHFPNYMTPLASIKLAFELNIEMWACQTKTQLPQKHQQYFWMFLICMAELVLLDIATNCDNLESCRGSSGSICRAVKSDLMVSH